MTPGSFESPFGEDQPEFSLFPERRRFAHAFNREVHVYQFVDPLVNPDVYPYKRVARFEAGDAASGPGGLESPPVNVVYCGGVHYDALVVSPEALVNL